MLALAFGISFLYETYPPQVAGLYECDDVSYGVPVASTCPILEAYLCTHCELSTGVKQLFPFPTLHNGEAALM
jgi:hypothetical protein